MKSGIVVFIGTPIKREIKFRKSRVDEIIDVVQSYYKVDLRVNTKKKKVVFPRQVAITK